MEILLNREFQNENTTLGTMVIDWGDYHCDTLEDAHHEPKIKGKTRIPEGAYEIKFRKVESELTKKYRTRFPWFTYHLELQDVPNFKYIYIHIGNNHEDTDGCILVGQRHNHLPILTDSTSTFETVYKLVSYALNKGEKVTISIA